MLGSWFVILKSTAKSTVKTFCVSFLTRRDVLRYGMPRARARRVLCVSVESNGTAGFHDLHRHTFNPPPVLHFAGVHKKGTDGLPDSISRTFCPSPPAGLRFTDFELIQMGIFSAREKPCGVQLACPPDFSAAPTLSSGLQSLNQRHQRAVDLFSDALKTILQPLKGLPPLPLRFTRFNERVKLVVSVVCPIMRRAAL